MQTVSQLGTVAAVGGRVADVGGGVGFVVVATTGGGWVTMPVTQVNTGPVSILSVSV